MDHNDLAWTAFRASLLSPLLTGEVASDERGAYFQKLAKQTHRLPDGKQRSPTRFGWEIFHIVRSYSSRASLAKRICRHGSIRTRVTLSMLDTAPAKLIDVSVLSVL